MTMTEADRDSASRPTPRPRPDDAPEVDGDTAVADATATADSTDTTSVDTSADAADEATGPQNSGGEPPVTDGSGTASGDRPKRPTPSVGVLMIALAVAVVAAATFAVLWVTQYIASADRAEVATAANDLAVDLTTYDYRELESNFKKVEEFSTGAFAKKYKDASGQLTTLLTQNKAISKGRVLHVGVSEISDDRAVVLVFVDQTINNLNTKDRIDRNRMVLTLLDEDGSWKLDDVKLM